MPAAKLPYFPFYVKDFAADSKVEAMTTEEVGAYILLLCKAWLEEPPGTLPNDDRVLARWARVDYERWMQMQCKCIAPFSLGPDGRWHQKRMEREATRLKKVSIMRTNAANSRWNNALAPDANAMQVQCKGHAKVYDSFGSIVLDQSSKKDTKRKRGCGGEGGGDAFASFWEIYPRKQGKQKARETWVRLAPDDALLATILDAVRRQVTWESWTKDGGKFIPHPATWLNGRRWEDQEQPTLFGGSNGAGSRVGPDSRVRPPAGKYDALPEIVAGETPTDRRATGGPLGEARPPLGQP